MRYIRYQPAADLLDPAGSVEDYWELADDGFALRSVHLLADGSCLRYGREHDADSLGVLPEGAVNAEMLADASLGTFTVLSRADFELLWGQPAKNRHA